MQKTLYLGNLAFRQEAAAVQRLIARCGNVVQFTMMEPVDVDRADAARGVGSGPGSGFAIAEMESEHDLVTAIDTLNGRSFNGQRLTARVASALEQSAAGQPRMFGTMNMGDDPNPPASV